MCIRRCWPWALSSGLAFAFCAASAQADSLFQQSREGTTTLIAEKAQEFEVGDLITVIVRETLDASTTADTETQKQSDVASDAPAADNPFFVDPNGFSIIDPAKLPNFDVSIDNETRNEGTTTRRNEFTTSITCRVVELLPNGVLRLEGKRRVTVNREESIVTLTGIARSRDVTPANTIDSTQIGDAEIELSGRGPLWNNQRRGILTKVLDWVSPF